MTQPQQNQADWEITVRSDRGWDWTFASSEYEVGDRYP